MDSWVESGDDIEDSYFVVVLRLGIDTVLLQKFDSIGYYPWKDYLYVYHDISIKACAGYYKDIWGNEIILSGEMQLNIRFKGWNSKVIIGNSVQLSDKIELNIGSNSYVKIGNDVKISEASMIRCEDNSSIIIGDKCIFEQSKIVSRNKIKIGNNCKSGNDLIIICEKNNEIELRNGVLLSSSVHMRSGNGHSLFVDAEKVNISERNQHIIIGNHVWIGQDVTVLSNAELMDGCVVGAKSLVKRKHGPNSLCYGVPAETKRNDIRWDSQNGLSYEDYLHNIK